MILYKTIALQYGRYVETGRPGQEYDLIGRMGWTEATQRQRQDILNDLSAARIYLLDHRAAICLDSLRMDVHGIPWQYRQEAQIKHYVSEVNFPAELVWVEFDSRQLWKDRIARGLTNMTDEQLRVWHQRGFLFDNRKSDQMTVRLFSAMTDRSFWDPPATLVLAKSQDGRPDFDSASWQLQENVVRAHMKTGSGDTEQDVKDLVREHQGHLTYEMVIDVTEKFQDSPKRD